MEIGRVSCSIKFNCKTSWIIEMDSSSIEFLP